MFGTRLAAALAALVVTALAAPAPAGAGELVAFSGFAPGTIVISNAERRLYYVVDPGRAIRYPVAVGKAGKRWSGVTRVAGRHWQPAWSPPAVVKRDLPHLPAVIPGGAPENPMGVAALTLARREIAIHGTNRPNSIGRYASYGCIRMHNRDIADLYRRVRVGTPVIVR